MIKAKSLVSTYYVGPTGIKNSKKVQQLLKQQIIRNSEKKRRRDRYKSSTEWKNKKEFIRIIIRQCYFASERAHSVSCPGTIVRNYHLFQLGFSNLGH